MTTIAEEFKNYQRNVMPSMCGDTQVVECRRAFYAGALSAITVLGNCGSSTILHDLRILCKELENFGKGGGL